MRSLRTAGATLGLAATSISLALFLAGTAASPKCSRAVLSSWHAVSRSAGMSANIKGGHELSRMRSGLADKPTHDDKDYSSSC